MASVPSEFLVNKIVSVLETEARLLGGIRDELAEIKDELVSMRAFLKDADMRRPFKEGEKTWVDNVRELVYDVEDIIDEFMYKVHKRQGRHESAKYLQKVAGSPKSLWEKHQIASRLQKIKAKIKATPERSKRYGINQVEGASSICTRTFLHGESSLFLKDDDLVGIDDGRELLVRWLTNGGTQRTTISVVGMGGSGKTTLAAKAYNSHTVKRQFDCYAWITVSQTYLIEDLFGSLIKQFYQAMKEPVPADVSNMSYRHLVELLVNYLQPKRYLVVLDDVWDTNLWHQVAVALPNSQHSCRVMLTTRKEDVASLCFEVGSHVHHVKSLQNNEAWALFCMKAFSRSASSCPPELEILAKEIVVKCQGLPLAIVSLAGLLSTKSSESEWRSVCHSLNWELSNNPMLQAVKSILLLSYNDLPFHLKHCFLYCCLFPEDHTIQRKKLVRLWMAEGFVKKVRGPTPEEVADQCFMELIRRSMLQVAERNSYGLPKACKMHDLLRELALSISEEENFCSVNERRPGEQESVAARRLSVQVNERGMEFSKSLPQLRSFLLFFPGMLKPFSFKTLLSSFKLLRVLDLEGAPIKKIPDTVVTFFNLRYLSLKRTEVKELPSSIGRLHNLETLNIDDTEVEYLPNGILKLKSLRYLLSRHFNHRRFYNFNYVTGTQMPLSISFLKNLQVLGCVEASRGMLGQLRSLTQLVRLEISNVRRSDELDLCSSIQNMPFLRRLFVMADEAEMLHMDALISPPVYLGRLSLVGKLKHIPQWFHSLQNLRTLHLRWSRLEEDPLPVVQALPNLRRLILVRAYDGSWLNFKGGFKNLEILEIHNCPQLQSISIVEGVMPSIKELCIGNCAKLTRLSLGIIKLPKLQALKLINPPEELVKLIRSAGMHHPLVQLIPKVNIVSYFP